MHLTWSPLGCPCLCWKSGLLVMVCSGGSVKTGASSPILCSCLENQRDTGAWWAAVYGVAQSRTKLKQLSSSSSPTLGACAGGRCHTVIQGSRQPEAPPAGDTVVVSIARGPALAAPVTVMSQGSSQRIGRSRVTFAPCLFQPRSTPFSQNRLRHNLHASFSFLSYVQSLLRQH